MKFVAISDTHGLHKMLTLPSADAIIHAGDVSQGGTKDEIIDFLDWFKDLNFNYKIMISGNHDFFFERNSNQVIKNIIPANVIYLQDSAVVIDNIKIWGSPVTPYFDNYAFKRQRGAEINEHWNKIPPDTDLLITHGPLFYCLDQNNENMHVGCQDLFTKIYSIKPKVHVFGHVHEGYGVVYDQGIQFINASVTDRNGLPTNKPVVFEFTQT